MVYAWPGVCVCVCVCVCYVGGGGLKGECGVERFILSSLIVVPQGTIIEAKRVHYQLVFERHIIVVSFV